MVKLMTSCFILLYFRIKTKWQTLQQVPLLLTQMLQGKSQVSSYLVQKFNLTKNIQFFFISKVTLLKILSYINFDHKHGKDIGLFVNKIP